MQAMTATKLETCGTCGGFHWVYAIIADEYAGRIIRRTLQMIYCPTCCHGTGKRREAEEG